MERLIYTFILFFSISVCIAISPSSENKKNILTTENEMFTHHFEKAMDLYKSDSLAASLISSYKALDLANKLNDPELITRSLMRIFQVQYKSFNYALSIPTARKAIESAPNDELKYRNYYNIGLAYRQINREDSALYYFTNAYDHFVQVQDPPNICKNLNQIGVTYFYIKDYQKSRAAYFDLLSYSTHANLDKFRGYALNNIGNSYLKENKFDSAIMFLEKGIDFMPDRYKMTIYLNLAKADNNNIEYLIKAKDFYENSLDVEDYIDVLQLLRRESNHDSAAMYAMMISDLVLEMKSGQASISDYSSKLEIQQIENLIAMERLKREQQEQRIELLWILCVSIVGVLFLCYLYVRIYKSKWLPKSTRYKMDLLNYQKREIEKTLRQFMDS